MKMSQGRGLAVVTGATGGIGAAICLRLQADGYGIIAEYRSSHEKAGELGDHIRGRGTFFKAVCSDLSTPDGVKAVVRAVRETLDDHPEYELRALINNAAKLLGPAFGEATVEQFDHYMAVNVRAPYFLCQELSPLMTAGSSILNISSASAHFSSPGDIIYAMSKTALESLTRNMAEAIAGQGLRVNSVIPGFTDNGHPEFHDPSALEYMSSFSVLGGVADPQVVADAVSFLVSDRANRTTGTALDVTGGSTVGARKRSVSSVRQFTEK